MTPPRHENDPNWWLPWINFPFGCSASQKGKRVKLQVCLSFQFHLKDLCLDVYCLWVTVPEISHTLTAVVTPSSAVLCPFCQESRREDNECLWRHMYHICQCRKVEKKERDTREYLQDCVGGSSPLCSSTGKPNNLRLPQKSTSFVHSPAGKPPWKG